MDNSRLSDKYLQLLEIGRLFTLSLELPVVLSTIVEQAVRLLEGEASILLTAEEDLLHLVATHNMPIESLPAREFRVEPGLMQTLEGLCGPNGACALLAAPLVLKEKTVGVIAVYRASGTEDDGEDERLLSALADRAAIAIENARIYEELRRYAELQRELQEQKERMLLAEREARLQAERAVRARDEHIAVASHEIRSPLTPLRGFAQRIVREAEKPGGPDVAALGKAARGVWAQSERLADLADRLVTLLELESGSLTLHPVDVDLVALAEKAVIKMRHVHPERTVVISAESATPVRVDASKLELVVTSLLDNALKFSSRASAVEVTVGPDGPDAALVAVRDHGTGIAQEERERIFLPFHRAIPDRHYGGMGMGLYLARRLVELHGGSLVLEQPEDGGSRFVARLPLRAKAVGILP